MPESCLLRRDPRLLTSLFSQEIENHQLIREVMASFQSSFYFYDLDAFEKHLKEIKGTLHPDITVWYATKANPLSEVLRILGTHGFGADVASLGELKLAQSAGLKAENLIATGPAKSRPYLGSLLEADVRTIVIESLNQLKDLNDICKKLGRYQDVLLRIQLDYEEGNKSVLGGQEVTPFGLGLEDWKSISLGDFPYIRVKGIHSFQWGNILDLSYLEKVWTESIKAAQRLSQEMHFELKILDLGGGLGISYTDDRELSFQDVHALLLRLKHHFNLNQIWLELGRFSIAKFGSYFTRIVDVKTVRGKNLIVTEGGINHMARPALVGESFPCDAFEVWGELKQFSVHGPLCTALDKLGDFELPETLKPGDWLRFDKAGAYGFSESMPYFLCHGLVGEAFRYKGEVSVPRVPRSHLDWMI